MCEYKLVFQSLEIAKEDLWQQIEKEVRGNAILQTNLKRMNHALQKWHLEFKQDMF